MGLGGWEGTLDWFKPLRLRAYPRRRARGEGEGGKLPTTALWFFPGRTSATYLVMVALCNCSLSHWSTILFCNTDDIHGIWIHSWSILSIPVIFFFPFTPPQPPIPMVVSRNSSLLKTMPLPKSSRIPHPPHHSPS